MFINGAVHMFLPAMGIALYCSSTGWDVDIRSSSTAFIAVIATVAIASLIIHYISFTIVQSSVCGKVFQSDHLAKLSGWGSLFAIAFLVLGWKVDFVGNIVRDFIPAEIRDQSFGEAIVLAFFVFFGGLYSIASLSWFATACPLPETSKIT